jgi:hypothetical protein
MNEAAREAREEAAERELTGRSNHGGRTVDEARAVQAGLERALTAQVPPLQIQTVPVEERMIVSLMEKLMERRPRSRRVCAMVWTAAADGGLSLRRWNRWEAAQESTKGGQEP